MSKISSVRLIVCQVTLMALQFSTTAHSQEVVVFSGVESAMEWLKAEELVGRGNS